MLPTEHALRALVDGALALGWSGAWETRVPTHDETLWLVQDQLCTQAWRQQPLEAVLVRAQLLHGRGSYCVAPEDPWAPPWRVKPGGILAAVDEGMQHG